MDNTIDNSSIKTDLEQKLREANLSEKEIQEVVPEILKLIDLKKDVEKKETESTTQNFLLDLRQNITNNSDVSIDIKRNQWTVIWTINVNNVRNNIQITINNPKPTTQQTHQQTPQHTTNTPQSTINTPRPTIQETTQHTTNIPQSTTQQTPQHRTNTPQQTTNVPPQTTNIPQHTVETKDKIERDIHDPRNFILVLDDLLKEIKDTRTGISKKKQTKAWKKGMDVAETKLDQYEKKIKWKKAALEKQLKNHVTPEISQYDINETKKIQSDIDDVRHDINLTQRWTFSNQWAFLYNSPEVARKSNIEQSKINEFEQKMKEEVKQWAILNIFNWKEDAAVDFYRRIAEWRYSEAEYSTYTINSWILNPSFQRCGINVPILTPSQLSSTWWTQTEQWTQIEQWSQTVQSPTTVDYSNLDRWESFARWGAAWLIDKALSNCGNLTPWQRNTRKSIAIMWGFAGAIYGLYKFYTKKDMWLLKKAWITAGVIFWTQVLTWENPISLFKKLMTWWLSLDDLQSKFWNAFWNAVDWVQSSWIEGSDNMSWAMYSLMVFNNTTKVWDVRALSTKFKNNPQEWEQFRWMAISKLSQNGQTTAERFSAVFSENFDENKRNERLSSIGIHDGIDDNKLVYELANAKAMNTIIINKFLSDNWVKVTDVKTKKEEFEQYKKSMNDNNKIIDISILETHKGDRFKQDNEASFTDRPEDKQNKEKLNRQVDQLSLDEQTKTELKKEIQLFYDERPIKSKPELNDFSLEMDNNLLVVKSHFWEKTKIDLQHKTIKWFWSSGDNKYEIWFTRIKDLLNVADLTNDILARQRNKPIASMPPFQYKPERKWICFNDAETLSFNFDTRVLSTGWWWATRKIDTLCEHPREYAEYLSARWIENLTPQAQQAAQQQAAQQKAPQTQQRTQ